MVPRSAARRAGAAAKRTVPGALRLAAQGAGVRRRAQPACAAGRHPPAAGARAAARRSPSTSAPATRRPRSGARIARTPPDILITTPESLYLLLTGQAREIAARRRARDRRRDPRARADQARRPPRALARAPRATWTGRRPAADRPVGDAASAATRSAATWAGGPRRSRSSTPERASELDLEIIVPVEDMERTGDAIDAEEAPGGAGRGARGRDSIWPSIYPRLLELIAAHRSTIIFVNSPPAGRAPGAAPQRAAAGPERSWCARTTARSRASSGSRSRRRSRPAGCARSSRPARSSSASTWARSTSWCRSSRRRRWRAACSGSAAPATTSAAERRARSSRSSAATCSRRRSSRSGCSTAAIETMRVPEQPARRARAADRGDGAPSTVAGRRAGELVTGAPTASRAVARAARGRARHAGRAAIRPTSSPSCGRG